MLIISKTKHLNYFHNRLWQPPLNYLSIWGNLGTTLIADNSLLYPFQGMIPTQNASNHRIISTSTS